MPRTIADLVSSKNLSENDVIATLTVCGLDPNQKEFSDEDIKNKFDVIHGFFHDGRVREGDWESAKNLYQELLKGQQQTKKRSGKTKKNTTKSDTLPSHSKEEKEYSPPASEQQQQQPDVIGSIQENVKVWTEGTLEIVDIAVEEEVKNVAQEIKERFPTKLNSALKDNQKEIELFFSEVKQVLIAGIEGKKLNPQSLSPPVSTQKALPESQKSSIKPAKISEDGTEDD